MMLQSYCIVCGNMYWSKGRVMEFFCSNECIHKFTTKKEPTS